MSARGQIYIGVIIALGIFLMLSQTIFTLVLAGFDLVNFTRTRTTAQAIATEKMETASNLPYDDVGTIGGIPPGVLLQSETVRKKGLPYTVLTSVIFIDDPFDGQAPIDTLPTDYKRVRVDVSWGGLAASRANTVTLISDIAPRGVESVEGGGTLSVLVFDSQGLPVPQAQVLIQAPSANPPVNLTIETSDTGRVVLPGAPECTGCYEITVTKEGMSTDRTYGTTEVANPITPHQTVLESQVTDVSFAIDRFARLSINTLNDRDNDFAPLANQIINLKGGKIIGTDTIDLPVHKFDQNIVTDSGGGLTIEELEWDTYVVTPPESEEKFIAGTNPLNPFSINPTDELTLLISLSESSPGLLSQFTDGGQNPIASVSATLRGDGEFEEVLISGSVDAPDYGQVFFKGLANGDYVLEATASGFLDSSESVVVNGYTKVLTILNPQ